MLTVGDKIKVKITDLDFQGQGVCRYEGYVIFIPKLLVDEIALVKISKLKQKFGQAEIVEIYEQSKSRVTHEHTRYGSCDMLHLDLLEQRKWQEKTTKETFNKILNKDLQIQPIIYDENDQHYRNKSVFHIMDNKILTFGLYDKTSSFLIPVEEFILSDHKTNEVLSFLSKQSIKVDSKVLKHIAFRTNQNQEVLVTLIAKENSFTGLKAILEALKEIKNLVGITLNIKDSDKHIFGETSFTLYGINEITETLKDKEIYLDDRSFFQINFPVIKKAYDLIEDFIEEQSNIVDAYCGCGSISFYLSNKAKHIVMIDFNTQSIINAMKTKFIHRLSHVDVICDNITSHKGDYIGYTLIVDPPRVGLDQKFIEYILDQKYPKLIYLSCDVKTLARDLVKLTENYEVNKVYPIKMFYHTSSTETLVLLSYKTTG